MPASGRTESIILEPLCHVMRMAAVTAALTPDVEPFNGYPAEGAHCHDPAPAAQPALQHRPLTAHFVIRAALRAHCCYHVLSVQYLNANLVKTL